MRDAKTIFAQAFEMEVSQLPDDISIGNVEQWDSLGHMRLLLAIENALGHQLSPEEAFAIDCLASVEKILA